MGRGGSGVMIMNLRAIGRRIVGLDGRDKGFQSLPWMEVLASSSPNSSGHSRSTESTQSGAGSPQRVAHLGP